jgi:hypothetical protein
MGQTALLPLRRKACWGFFSPLKIRRLRPGLNPRTWVLKASTLPLDHRSTYIGFVLRFWTLLSHIQCFIFVKLGWKAIRIKICHWGGWGGVEIPRQGRLFLPVNVDWKQCETFRSGEDDVMRRVLLGMWSGGKERENLGWVFCSEGNIVMECWSLLGKLQSSKFSYFPNPNQKKSDMCVFLFWGASSPLCVY